MAQLNYKKELVGLENDIVGKTVAENQDVLELIAANLNSLYGLSSVLHGANDYIFPVNTVERSKKFLVMLYTISAFQISSSIFDLTISGKYPEASVLMRSLIETVGFAEYYFLNPPSPKLLTVDVKKLPSRQTVFRYLAKNGNWPKGGPDRKFKQYNDDAHADIKSVVEHWGDASGEPLVARIWLRRYNHQSFYDLMKDLVIPLIAIKQIFRETFSEQIDSFEDKSWLHYWQIGQKRETINRLFPELRFGIPK